MLRDAFARETVTPTMGPVPETVYTGPPPFANSAIACQILVATVLSSEILSGGKRDRCCGVPAPLRIEGIWGLGFG